MQTVLIEQIIPQLVQVTGGQVSLLQYLFCDEQQPFTAQFIQDGQAVLSQSNPHNEQNNFGAQQSFFEQRMSHSSYSINPDLIAKTGAFAQVAVYQRLYG